MIPKFRAIGTTDRVLQKLQDALSKIFNSLETKSIIDGRLINDVFITSGTPKEIDHGLQRPIIGWIIVGKNANAVVWSSISDIPNRTLIFNASANVTVSLWVF